MKKLLFSIGFVLYTWILSAQPSQTLYSVIVQPNKADWTYKTGEETEFEIYVTHNKVPLNNIALRCEYGPEAMPPVKTLNVEVKNSKTKIKIPGMKVPGFQTFRASFEVDGKTYTGYANVGYEPYKIEPTQVMPADFREFWENVKAEAARIPLEPLLTLQPDLCTPSLNVYHIRFQNNAYENYIYGMLCVPKKQGKYPAILELPGSGLHSFQGNKPLADRGVITLQIGVHGIPVNLPQEVYNNLASGALRGYAWYNLEDKDRYYMKRVLIGCKRAIDFIYSLDAFDKQNVAVMGGSQGGALSIITAALDSRVKCFASRHPGSCDMSGFMNGRPGGSPGLKENPNIRLQLETSKYYDVVNFARILTVPGFFTWGYNDTACWPTTTFSAYNVVTSEKTLKVYPETAHWHFPEQNAAFENWVLERLGVK